MVNTEDGSVVSLNDRTNAATAANHTEVDMKVRNIILTLAAAVLLTIPSAAIAQTGPGPGQGGGGGWGQGHHDGWFGGGIGDVHGLGFLERMLPRLAEELGLSEEQLQEIQAIVAEERPRIEELAGELRALHETRRETHDPAVFDEGAVRAFAQQQFLVQVELMVVVERTRAGALQVLTEEQRQQLEEMRGEMGTRFKRRSGGRRPQ
jgi:Spy/CpxP family protein refolding chaperone